MEVCFSDWTTERALSVRTRVSVIKGTAVVVGTLAHGLILPGIRKVEIVKQKLMGPGYSHPLTLPLDEHIVERM